MVTCHADQLEDFPGASNQTRCFAHTISIAAKAILKQFDIPKAKHGKDLDDTAQVLADLAEGLEIEDSAEQDNRTVEDDEEGEDDQPLDMWVDFREGLTAEQLAELEESVQPVRSMLAKVCLLQLHL
jgi:hypothetical protein